VLARLYGGVLVGTISECVGNPGAAPKWQWNCGAATQARGRAKCSSGSAASFDEARDAFETAWRVFLSNRVGRRL
jgi:hypothetical protein